MGFFDQVNFNSVGGAVGDLFGGVAGFQEASAYQKAADIAKQNEQLAATSTQLQQLQASREAYRTVSGQKADISGAGFAAGGSAGDLLRSSEAQARLQTAVIGTQGQIQEAGFAAQAASYQGQAQAAQTKGAGGILGGIIKGVGAIAGLLAL